MDLLVLVLLICALACFAIGCVRGGCGDQAGTGYHRLNLVALGLVFVTISWIITQADAMNLGGK